MGVCTYLGASLRPGHRQALLHLLGRDVAVLDEHQQVQVRVKAVGAVRDLQRGDIAKPSQLRLERRKGPIILFHQVEGTVLARELGQQIIQPVVLRVPEIQRQEQRPQTVVTDGPASAFLDLIGLALRDLAHAQGAKPLIGAYLGTSDERLVVLLAVHSGDLTAGQRVAVALETAVRLAVLALR